MSEQEYVIAAAMLPFPGRDQEGVEVQDAAPEVWHSCLAEVRRNGFDAVDLTDSWVRPGDLVPTRLEALRGVLGEVGLKVTAISAIRRSIIDPGSWAENLAYSHRTLEAAAHLGCPLVSIGFHRPLTHEQKQVLWFWSVDGPRDSDDPDSWRVAVERTREVGVHARELGLQLSLEMYEDTLLGTSASAVRLVEEIGLENVGLNPDTGNLVRLHRAIEAPEDLLGRCLPFANYWHMKNYLRADHPPSGAVMTMPTSLELGVINYRKGLDIAMRAGFSGPFCLEQYGGDGLSVMSSNRRYLIDLLGAYAQ